MKDLLTVDTLFVHAGQKPLVSNMSFSLKQGERLGLIGESGSGKSMTALAIIGLLPTAARATGSILLNGHQVIGAGDRDMTRLRGATVATVFQEPLTALDPLMKIGVQVAQPVRRRRLCEREPADRRAVFREVTELLEKVALPQPERIAASWPHEISGGQRQRVAIAMALACRPRLLIADEPTTALDVTTQADILSLLDTLVRDENMALLFISHDLPVVATITDRVMVLRHGVMVEQGPVSQVFSQPADAYTRTLVEAARAFDTVLQVSA